MQKDINMWKIIKIGGSLLSPTNTQLFDFDYANELKEAILSTDIPHFSLTAGGGRLTRMLMEHAQNNIDVVKLDLHKIGVITSNVNNEFLRIVFQKEAYEDVLRFKLYDEFIEGIEIKELYKQRVLVAASSKPGYSNDWNALHMAIRLGATEVFNLKDIDGVYSANPKEDDSAQLVPRLSWDEYFDIIGNPDDFTPGGNFPIDILAARKAQEEKITFYILDGKDLKNVKNALTGKEFHGTVVGR